MALCASLAALAGTPGIASADQVFWDKRELLRDFFPDSERVGFRRFDLDPARRLRLQQRLGYELAKQRYTFFVATTDGRVDGYALLDDEKGQHLPITFAVRFSPNGTITRQELVAYREAYGSEIRSPRFRRQFVGKTVADPIRAGSDIVVITGATISSRSMAAGVRRASVLLDELVLSGRARLSSGARAARSGSGGDVQGP